MNERMACAGLFGYDDGHERFVSQHLGGDPQRVFVMGQGAGGYNAAMLALDPRWLEEAGTSPARLAGFIGLAGPYDFLPTDLPDVRPVFHHPDYPPAAQPIDHVRHWRRRHSSRPGAMIAR